MIPRETGNYWLKLTPISNWQTVYVIRGEDVLFAGLSERMTEPAFSRQYPEAVFSERLQPPDTRPAPQGQGEAGAATEGVQRGS